MYGIPWNSAGEGTNSGKIPTYSINPLPWIPLLRRLPEVWRVRKGSYLEAGEAPLEGNLRRLHIDGLKGGEAARDTFLDMNTISWLVKCCLLYQEVVLLRSYHLGGEGGADGGGPAGDVLVTARLGHHSEGVVPKWQNQSILQLFQNSNVRKDTVLLYLRPPPKQKEGTYRGRRNTMQFAETTPHSRKVLPKAGRKTHSRKENPRQEGNTPQ
jgi:hypothetical protein